MAMHDLQKRTLQNRKAQKDFRQRRATYLKHLEAKVQQYEEDGSDSAPELQQTIQQLAQENHYLRTVVSRLQDELAYYRDGRGGHPAHQHRIEQQFAHVPMSPSSTGTSTPTFGPPSLDSGSMYRPSHFVHPAMAPRTSFSFTAGAVVSPGAAPASPALHPSQQQLEMETGGFSNNSSRPSTNQMPYVNLPDAWTAPFYDTSVSLETPPLDVASQPGHLFPTTTVSPPSAGPTYFNYITARHPYPIPAAMPDGVEQRHSPEGSYQMREGLDMLRHEASGHERGQMSEMPLESQREPSWQ